MWAAAALLLGIPAIAMQFTSEVDWTASDFIVMGIMLGTAFGTFDLASRMSGSITYRTGVGVAVLASFLLVWINLAVGIIGSEDNPANLMFGVVLIVALVGSLVARFQAAGMSRTMVVTAAVQAGIGIIALVGNLGAGKPIWPADIVALTLFFTAMWLGSAWLFRLARD
jgi:hypothetical protein